MPLTQKQQTEVAQLMAAHRNVNGCADYEDSPSMQAMFKYVNKLLRSVVRKTKEDANAR
jgi:hypothetical protein